MAAFQYAGRGADGAEIKGVIDAPNESAAAGLLLQRGVTPIRISASAAGVSFDAGKLFKGLFAEKVQPIDVMLFSRQLYTLLRSGVPILRALAGLQESMTNPAMKAVLQDVRESLQGGRELSASLARHPRVFTPFYLAMVRVGEMTGLLEDIFLRLYEHLDFERFMREQVRSALRYPTFVIIAMAGAIMVVNLFVIPAFAQVFKNLNAQLPLMTRLLMGFSELMVNYWYLLFGGTVAAIFGFRHWASTKEGRLRWDEMKLGFPVAGKIIRKATLARFSRSFALASKSGVPITQALSNVALTVDNVFIARKIEGMRETVERGDTVLKAAIGAKVFTPVVLQMIAVGEESGALDEMMGEIAEMYQREVEYELKTLAQQIEPILIVFLGVLVLVLAMGIFLPIWDLGKAAFGK
nr:type II secretion system F family protein [Dechloromonas sp.]